MDPLTNPYAPGAGTPPPELAGRDSILAAADIAIQRNRLCRPARSFMFIGLRGVGKTVLLNEVGRIAEKHDAISDFFEVGTNGPLAQTIITTLRTALLELDRGGILSRDLADLFMAAGEAARAHKTSIVVLVDEIQNLPVEEFGALIMAIHHADQKQLPILVVGAGLPSLVKLSAEIMSYAERLFEYPDVGALDDEGCRRALVEPAVREGVAFDDTVIAAVTDITTGKEIPAGHGQPWPRPFLSVGRCRGGNEQENLLPTPYPCSTTSCDAHVDRRSHAAMSYASVVIRRRPH